MAEQGVTNGGQSVLDVTLSYISGDNESQPEPPLPPVISSYYDDGGSWFFSSHDIPILIGAAAGAIGLILIFLAAALIWHCYQFALQREKSSYSLDNDSERNSVSSRGSNLYINNPMIDEKSMARETSDQNLKRSISAPIHRDSRGNGAPQVRPDPIGSSGSALTHDLHIQSNTQTPVFKANDFNSSDKSNDKKMVTDYADERLTRSRNSVSMELSDAKPDNDSDCQRSRMYVTNSMAVDDTSELRSKSLPWSQSNKKKTVTIDQSEDDYQPKINFSKKRKNRMRNDSAAAIALNRSGTIIASDPNNKVFHSHKDTDTLVDNEAIVVYDERTAL